MKYPKIHYILSIFICGIPPALVAGAAIVELFVILSCLLFFFLNFNKLGTEYYKKYFFIIFLAFSFFLIFGSFSSQYIQNSLRNTLFYFRFGILILIIWYLLDHYKKFKFLFFYSLSITLLVVILYSLLQIFVLHNAIHSSRISGLFGEELIQGSYLLKITPIFIAFYYYNKKHLSKNYYFLFNIILLLIYILIIFSGERASIFLMTLGIFLFFIFLKISLKKIFVFAVLFFSIFFLTINLYPLTKDRIITETYNQIFSKDNNSIKINVFSEGHQNHFKTAVIIFEKYYLKGVGVRNFRLECQKDAYKDIGRYNCTTHPHNTYMQLLSETGLIGLSFFLFFLIFVCKNSFLFLKKNYTKNKKINKSLAFCFIAILVNFFPFITTGSFFNNWLTTLYCLPVAILLYELSSKKNNFNE